MTDLLPNLHWIEGRASNVYLWIGETKLALVDTGCYRLRSRPSIPGPLRRGDYDAG